MDTDKPITNSASTSAAATTSKVYVAPVQTQIQEKIELVNSDLVGLFQRDKNGLLTEEKSKELQDKKKLKKDLEKQLKRKIEDQKRSKIYREEKKSRLAAIVSSNEDLRKSLKIRTKPGRPSLETDQPLLLKTIVDLAIYGSASHDKRQCDMYRSIKTLDELHSELLRNGFNLSRSGLYLRLLPKRSGSLEGKRHVTTVPVRLIRAQNDQHSKHVDGKFCASTIRRLEELASLLGPHEVSFLSQDDKARVPIGITAAKKQSPMLMHLEYRISLPDHDWVVAAGHKLIPSVYAGNI